MFGGLQGQLPRRRLAVVVASPVLAAAAIGTGFAFPHRTIPLVASHIRVASVVPALPTGRISVSYLRSLPHDEIASVGRPRFRQLPPSFGHLDAKGALLVASGAAIPSIALTAYERAAGELAASDPACHLSWPDIAGIGRVESDNGQTWGVRARVSAAGTLSPPIIGPALDGQDGFPAYRTPDRGRLEHDKGWEHAVGPMQFLPSTWLEYAQDGNGDGVKDPENFFDSSLTTAVFLCANGGDLAKASGLDPAVLAYNHSASYLSLVTAWVSFYQQTGAARLMAVGSGLLQAGVSSFHEGHARTRSKRKGAHPVSPLAYLTKDAAVALARGSYSVSYTETISGRTIAAGDAAVNLANDRVGGAVTLGSSGKVFFRRVAGVVYIALPRPLARGLGVRPDEWFVLSHELAARLPAAVVEQISFAASELSSAVAGLEGATSAARLDPSAAILGTINLSLAARRAPHAAADLARVENEVGTAILHFAARLDPAGLPVQISISAPHLYAVTRAPVAFRLNLYGFGSPVFVSAPPVGEYPPPTTTTTTEPSTSTTTTTEPSTSTTTAPSTSSTSSGSP